MRYFVKTVILAGVFMGISLDAKASVLWDWAFLDSNETFGANDKVFLRARLFNHSTDGETIGRPDSGSRAALAGSVAQPIPFYSFVSGSEGGSIFDVFVTPLAAGSSRDFVFGREMPVGVPAGEYAQGASIDLRNGFEDGVPLVSRIDRDFSWEASGHPEPVVPEPGSWSLLGLGLGSLFIKKKMDDAK